MKILLFLLLPISSFAASTLVYVRVFYKADGAFMVKYIRSDRTAAIIAPQWATGSCDILAKDWVKADAQKERVRVNLVDCSFYQAPKSVKDLQRDTDRALAAKMKAGTASAADKDELLKILLKKLGMIK